MTSAPSTRTLVLRRSASASQRPLPLAHVVELGVDQSPARRERGVVGAELDLLAGRRTRWTSGPGKSALLHQPDGPPVLLDEVDGTVDGGLDEPRDLVLGADLLGVEQATLGGRELARRRELGGGHLPQLALVEPHLAGRPASAGPRRVGDAAGADALAT